MKKVIALLFILTFLHATTIEGKIINSDTFETMDNVIIKISGDTTFQSVFSKGYNISAEPGEYLLEARYYEDGEIKYSTKEQVLLKGEKVKYDLVLFPESFTGEYDLEEEEYPEIEGETDLFVVYVLGAAAVAIFIGLLYLGGRPKKQETETGQNEPMDEDCEKVIRVLKEQEGRMLQKELREVLNFSEPKMSIIMTELEALGRIKRIKKGREKIVKLI
ncbi:hypothetical protein JXB01_03455 [Candidatus Micrarchaeota archaeon]|nr:hypothetical protein [Candidatus Micrarchaeota archaeon]